jgi:hypothetical protein
MPEAAFSASSRLFGPKRAANRFKSKRINAIMTASVK